MFVFWVKIIAMADKEWEYHAKAWFYDEV